MATMTKKREREVQEPELPEEAKDEELEETEDIEPVEMLSREETSNAIYAMLFASDRPLSATRLAEALGDIDPMIVASLLEELRGRITEEKWPYTLLEMAGGYPFTAQPGPPPLPRGTLGT